MTITAWLRRYPLLIYLMLTFGVSWGGILLVLKPVPLDLNRGFPGAADRQNLSK